MSQPSRVAVVGAGIVGLSTAWSLLRRGVQVEVFDAGDPGGGATHGNAGWVTPGLVEPLGSPAMAREGATAILSRSSPVSVRLDTPGTVPFLLQLLRSSTASSYAAGVAALRPLAERALGSYEEMDGLAPLRRSDIVAVFSGTAARDAFVDGHRHHPVAVEPSSTDSARDAIGSDSEWIDAAAVVRDQAFVDPGLWAAALTQSVESMGGVIHRRRPVVAVTRLGSLIAVETDHRDEPFDAVVIATGAARARMLRAHGVGTRVMAGRGYSFSALHGRAPDVPVYIPEHRLACTPMDGRLRIVGAMEFGRHGAPARAGQIDRMRRAATEVLGDLGPTTDPWVGSRPCTPDGLPLLGETATPGVFAALGHGMWGVTLGPVSGELVARAVLGEQEDALRPFAPTRGRGRERGPSPLGGISSSSRHEGSS